MMTKLHAYVCKLETIRISLTVLLIISLCVIAVQYIHCNSFHADKFELITIDGKRLPKNVDRVEIKYWLGESLQASNEIGRTHD